MPGQELHEKPLHARQREEDELQAFPVQQEELEGTRSGREDGPRSPSGEEKSKVKEASDSAPREEIELVETGRVETTALRQGEGRGEGGVKEGRQQEGTSPSHEEPGLASVAVLVAPEPEQQTPAE